jgi:hypothetical protein
MSRYASRSPYDCADTRRVTGPTERLKAGKDLARRSCGLLHAKQLKVPFIGGHECLGLDRHRWAQTTTVAHVEHQPRVAGYPASEGGWCHIVLSQESFDFPIDVHVHSFPSGTTLSGCSHRRIDENMIGTLLIGKILLV